MKEDMLQNKLPTFYGVGVWLKKHPWRVLLLGFMLIVVLIPLTYYISIKPYNSVSDVCGGLSLLGPGAGGVVVEDSN